MGNSEFKEITLLLFFIGLASLGVMGFPSMIVPAPPYAHLQYFPESPYYQSEFTSPFGFQEAFAEPISAYDFNPILSYSLLVAPANFYSDLDPFADWLVIQEEKISKAILPEAFGAIPNQVENVTTTAVIDDVLIEWSEVIASPTVDNYFIERRSPLGWNITTMDSVANYTAPSNTTIQTEGIFFREDGKKLYIVFNDPTSDFIDEYTLSNPYDPSSATWEYSLDVSGENTVTEGIHFKPDGTIMATVGITLDELNYYTLSTPWDLSTASHTGIFTLSGDQVPRGLWVRDDGLKFYSTGTFSERVMEFDMSSAWDFSTSSFNQSLTVNVNSINPNDIEFKDDGTLFLLLSDESPNEIDRYDLSTPWDISTAVYNSTYGIEVELGDETTTEGFHVTQDGLTVFTLGNDLDEFKEFSITPSGNGDWETVIISAYFDDFSTDKGWLIKNSTFMQVDTGSGTLNMTKPITDPSADGWGGLRTGGNTRASINMSEALGTEIQDTWSIRSKVVFTEIDDTNGIFNASFPSSTGQHDSHHRGEFMFGLTDENATSIGNGWGQSAGTNAIMFQISPYDKDWQIRASNTTFSPGAEVNLNTDAFVNADEYYIEWVKSGTGNDIAYSASVYLDPDFTDVWSDMEHIHSGVIPTQLPIEDMDILMVGGPRGNTPTCSSHTYYTGCSFSALVYVDYIAFYNGVNVTGFGAVENEFSVIDALVELGTDYDYRIKAGNADGNGTHSDISEVLTNDVPAKVTGLIGSRDTSTQIDLQWDEVDDDSGVGFPSTGVNLTSYQVFRNNGSGFELAGANLRQSPPVIFFNDTSLNATLAYTYKISACNEVGCGANSSSTFVNVTGTTVPDQVTGLTIIQDMKNEASMDWDDVAGADNYQVLKKTNFTTTGEVNSNSTWSYREQHLNPDNSIDPNCTVSMDGSGNSGHVNFRSIDGGAKISECYLWKTFPRELLNNTVATVNFDFSNSIGSDTLSMLTIVSDEPNDLSIRADDTEFPLFGSKSWNDEGTIIDTEALTLNAGRTSETSTIGSVTWKNNPSDYVTLMFELQDVSVLTQSPSFKFYWLNITDITTGLPVAFYNFSGGSTVNERSGLCGGDGTLPDDCDYGIVDAGFVNVTGGIDFEVIATPTLSQYNDTSISLAGITTYKVRANNSAGFGANSTEVDFGLIQPMSGLSATTLNETAIQLNWTAVTTEHPTDPLTGVIIQSRDAVDIWYDGFSSTATLQDESIRPSGSSDMFGLMQRVYVDESFEIDFLTIRLKEGTLTPTPATVSNFSAFVVSDPNDGDTIATFDSNIIANSTNFFSSELLTDQYQTFVFEFPANTIPKGFHGFGVEFHDFHDKNVNVEVQDDPDWVTVTNGLPTGNSTMLMFGEQGCNVNTWKLDGCGTPDKDIVGMEVIGNGYSLDWAGGTPSFSTIDYGDFVTLTTVDELDTSYIDNSLSELTSKSYRVKGSSAISTGAFLENEVASNTTDSGVLPPVKPIDVNATAIQRDVLIEWTQPIGDGIISDNATDFEIKRNGTTIVSSLDAIVQGVFNDDFGTYPTNASADLVWVPSKSGFDSADDIIGVNVTDDQIFFTTNPSSGSKIVLDLESLIGQNLTDNSGVGDFNMTWTHELTFVSGGIASTGEMKVMLVDRDTTATGTQTGISVGYFYQGDGFTDDNILRVAEDNTGFLSFDDIDSNCGSGSLTFPNTMPFDDFPDNGAVKIYNTLTKTGQDLVFKSALTDDYSGWCESSSTATETFDNIKFLKLHRLGTGSNGIEQGWRFDDFQISINGTFVPLTIYIDKNPGLDETFSYSIVPSNSAGDGTESDPAIVTTNDFPDTPTGESAMALSGSEIEVTWTNPTDFGDGSPTTGIEPKEIKIFKENTTDTSGFFLLTTVPSTPTSFSDFEVDAGKNYTYKLSAKNSIGTSGNTTEVTAFTVDNTIIFTVKENAGIITLGNKAFVTIDNGIDSQTKLTNPAGKVQFNEKVGNYDIIVKETENNFVVLKTDETFVGTGMEAFNLQTFIFRTNCLVNDPPTDPDLRIMVNHTDAHIITAHPTPVCVENLSTEDHEVTWTGTFTSDSGSASSFSSKMIAKILRPDTFGTGNEVFEVDSNNVNIGYNSGTKKLTSNSFTVGLGTSSPTLSFFLNLDEVPEGQGGGGDIGNPPAPPKTGSAGGQQSTSSPAPFGEFQLAALSIASDKLFLIAGDRVESQLIIDWNVNENFVITGVDILKNPRWFAFESLPKPFNAQGAFGKADLAFTIQLDPNYCNSNTGIIVNCVERGIIDIPITVLGVVGGKQVTEDHFIQIDTSERFGLSTFLIIFFVFFLVIALAVASQRASKKNGKKAQPKVKKRVSQKKKGKGSTVRNLKSRR